MNVTRKVGAVLGAIAVLLAAPLDSGGIVGSGPCSTAYVLRNLDGVEAHSFGGNFTPAWHMYLRDTQRRSHLA